MSGKVLERAFAPMAPIKDGAELGFTFTVDDAFRAGAVRLDLDLAHPDRSDLEVFITAPNGKRVQLARRAEFHQPAVKDSFDLSAAFDRLSVKGEWKLSIVDYGRGDDGTLNAWKVRFEEGDQRPTPPKASPADDHSSLAGSVSLQTSPAANGRHQLLDTSRGQGVETRDAWWMEHGTLDGATTKPITDDDDVWGEATDGPREKTAIDAHYAAQMTYDFLRDFYGRDSLDGHGEKLLTVVHAGPAVRAYTAWCGDQVMVVEDRRGQSLASIDAIATEFGWGLVDRAVNLIGWGEQMAVRAAFSQIIGGAGVEWYAAQRNPVLAQTANPYLVGESMDMADPTSDGYTVDHYSHYNLSSPRTADGVVTNAFYLLTHGGTNKTSGLSVADPIGLERGLKIFGQALFNHLPVKAGFAQTRQATLEAASDLYGANSVEVERLKQAWNAVGVDAPSAAKPSP